MNKKTARIIIKDSAFHPLKEVEEARKVLGLQEIQAGDNPTKKTLKKHGQKQQG